MTDARVAVVALKPFAYRGQSVAAGELCLVRPIEAAALLYRRQARWVQEDEAAGVYARRDLVADEPSVRGRAQRPRRPPEAS